jgi:hypothetical protein
LWEKLLAPFPESDIDWLLKEEDVSRGPDGVTRGRCFPFINARAVQRRLDQVFGLYWATKMSPTTFGGGTRAGVICDLSVYLPGVGWLTKSDACDLSQIEPVRGGASGALKRVAVQFGIGRYLYDLSDCTVVLSAKGGRRLRIDNHTVLCWDPPLLPAWALPAGDRSAREQQLAEIALGAAGEATRVQTDTEAKVAEGLAREQEAKSKQLPPTAQSTVKSALTPAVLDRLAAILGDDQAFALTYLKHKRLLPAGATGIEQLAPAHAEALLCNSGKVAARMIALAPVSKLVGGRHEQATSCFVARSFVKANEPWFAAADAALNQVAAEGTVFSQALDAMSIFATAA